MGKAVAFWEEVKPDKRDLFYLAGGAVGMLLLTALGQLLTGIRFTYIAGLVTGMAASYCLDLFLSWRRGHKEGMDG